MDANWQPKPIYCPRRPGIECDTPNACAGGADCRFGPDPATQRRIFSLRLLSKISLLKPHGHLPSRCSSRSRWCCCSLRMSSYSRVSTTMLWLFDQATAVSPASSSGTNPMTTFSHASTRYLCGVGVGCGAGNT